MYKYEKREEEKIMISRKIRVFESILEKYKKINIRRRNE